MSHDWYKRLNDVLRPRNYEMIRTDKANLFIGPRDLSAEEKRNILSLLPDDLKVLHNRFEVGLKAQTVTQLSFILGSIGPHHVEAEGSRGARILIGIDTPIEKIDTNAQIWRDINDILLKDGFLQRWSVYIRREQLYEVNAGAIRAVSDHQDVRETVISDDDVLNLRIALESAKDVNDFLEAL